jgi:molecular chaperone GrpE
VSDPFAAHVASGPTPASAEPAEAEAQAPAAAPAEELERLAAERDQYLDQLRRLKAEFDNYRKRQERDRQIVAQAGARDVVADLLPVMDNLERAVAALGDAAPGLVAGVDMVRQQLAGLLGERGVSEIDAHGERFDPTVHEAVTMAPSAEHAEGTVLAVVEKGYLLNDAVLRPARVVVATRPER